MKYCLFLITAFITAYASEWGPHYVALFSDGRLKVIGDITSFSEPCAESSRNGSECKIIYRIPKHIIDFSLSGQAIGLGVIVHATEIACSGDSSPKIRFGQAEAAGRTLDYLNIYQTVLLSDLSCNSDIIVKVWSPAAYRRYGKIDAPAVIGEASQVERVKRFVEFFRSSFLMMVTALFIGIFFFNKVILEIAPLGKARSLVELFSLEWLSFMLIASGIANTLIPVLSNTFVFARASNFFVLVNVFGTAIALVTGLRTESGNYFSELIKKISGRGVHKMRIPWEYLIALACVSTPYFAVGYAPILTVGSCALLSIGLFRRSSYAVFYGIALLSDALKLFMFPRLPTSYVFMVYLLLSQSHLFIERIRRSTSLVASLRWTRHQIENLNAAKSLPELLREFAELFSLRQITVLSHKEGGQCELIVQRRTASGWQVETIHKDTLPPIFSHVITTREPLWHVEEDSMLAINLRKGEARTRKYNGRYFSVVPLLKDSSPVGAISFTDYDDKYANDESYRLQLNSVINLLFSFVASSLSHKGASEREGWTSLCLEVVRELNSLKAISGEDLKGTIERAGEIIASRLSASLFIGRLDIASRRIHMEAICGHEESTKQKYKSIQFYSVSHNEQGPIPLALNRNKIVTVGDINWIRNVLHPISLEIFGKSGIRSCAAIPLLEPPVSAADGETISQDTWGVLWLESQHAGAFSPQSEPGLKLISSAVEGLLAHYHMVGESVRAKRALAGFVPENTLRKLLAGGSVRQEENGLLLMADLKDSTRLSRLVGAEKWNDFTKRLAQPVEHIARSFGFSLQMIVWDAFYLTKATEENNYEVNNALKLATALNTLFEYAFNKTFGSDINKTAISRARFCLIYGDITRDIKGSLTNSWSIVGHAMAAVSKLEQTCKGMQGWFFASETTLSGRFLGPWQFLDTCIPGTQDNICRYTKDIELGLQDPSWALVFDESLNTSNAA